MSDLPMTNIAFMRHAKTIWNEERRIQGWLDSPLSNVGRLQTCEWADRMAPMPFDRLICSDLGRAKETGEILATRLNLPVDEDCRFRERCFGNFEGKPYASCTQVGPEDRPSGGENLLEVRERALEATMDLHKYGNERILVVTHHGVLKSLLSHLAGPAHPLYEGRLLKSKRLHWVGIKGPFVGIAELNGRMR